MSESIKVQCRCCDGTGLYQGFCEAEGEAVVCLTCDGTGCETVRYTSFSGRKAKRGIKIVRRSRGSFIATGVGGTRESISYADFAKGKMPK